MSSRLTDDERQALRDFAALGISVAEFLSRMRDKSKSVTFAQVIERSVLRRYLTAL